MINIVLVVCACLGAGSSQVQEATSDGPRILRVDVHDIPGMCVKQKDGYWDGYEVRIVRRIAGRLGYSDIAFREVDMQHKLQGVIEGSADVAIGAITVDADREELGDFTFPHFTSGYGIVVREREYSFSQRALHAFLALLNRRDVWMLLAIFAGSVTVASFALSYTERRFRSAETKLFAWWGLWCWWSFATVLQIEPGEAVPKTGKGRTFAVLAMLAFLLFTVSIASTTINDAIAAAMSDEPGTVALGGKVVATKALSTSEEMSHQRGAAVLTCPTIEDALAKLEKGEVDAVIYDAQTLKCILPQRKPTPGWKLSLREVFGCQYFAAFVAEGSDLPEHWNRELLRIPVAETEEWQKLFLNQ